VVTAAVVLIFLVVLDANWESADPLLMLAIIAPIALAELWHLYHLLPHNHRHDETQVLPSFGLGTVLTVIRGVLLAMLAGLIVLPRPISGWLAWLPAGLYLSAAVADYLDGLAARLSNHATLLGQEYDMDLDALGILIAPLLGVLYGQLPVWYLLVSAARYLFIVGIWWLKRAGKPVYPLTNSPARRYLAGFQMGFCAIVLMPVFSPPGTAIVATIFMIPFMIGFYRDWLVVSRSIDAQSGSYQTIERRLNTIFIEWLPLPLRVSLLGLVAVYMIGGAPAGPRDLLMIVGGVVLAAAGIIGRLGAFLVLLGVNLQTLGLDFTPIQFAITIVSSCLMLSGSGKFALWRPDETFLRVKAGSKKAEL
jgi:CDP-diacylglycerol---glycerol-3-phosphate 3-phosphatidyltransferase